MQSSKPFTHCRVLVQRLNARFPRNCKRDGRDRLGDQVLLISTAPLGPLYRPLLSNKCCALACLAPLVSHHSRCIKMRVLNRSLAWKAYAYAFQPFLCAQ